ncbi:hypothetical protein FBULB1_4361 [Fusarium bulbicola]|nr:hypothetical protein FBULB1_4361 [Fusarium bulbicola]
MSKSSEICNSTCQNSPKEVPSYGDVGGIGVTLAFVITAWNVVIVLVGYYLKVFDPRLDPFRKEGTQKLTKYPNSIDYSVHEILQSLPWLKHDFKSISPRSSRLGTVLNTCVLMFADIQIFTSLAILIGAYASVRCDIVAYHWQYMIYLAWLASITHLASLSFLRNHLANNPAKRAWRLVAMFTIQVLLSVAVGLSMTFTEDDKNDYEDPYKDPWLNHGGRPAQCYFKQGVNTDSVTFQSGIKFIFLLVWGFAIRIAKTFEGFEGGLRKTASRLEQRGNRHRRVYSGSTRREWDHTFAHASLPRRVWSYFFVPISIGFYSVLSIQLDLFTSLLAEVYWLFFTIIWITARLIKLRIVGNQDDSEWTFGQVLPIILLVAPLALTIEASYTASTSNRPDITVLNPNNIRDLSHTHSSAYRGVFFLAVLSYIELAVYFVLDRSETQGIAIPLVMISLSAFILQPVLQLSWVVCNLWLDKMAWDMPLKRTIRHVVLFLLVSFLKVWAEKKDLSKSMVFHVGSVCLICLSPVCLVVVVTSPRLKRFVDLRILLPDNDPSWTGQDEPLPLSRLDWAIAGTTVSTKIPDPEGNLTSHSTFHQWISSRTLDSDAGFMYPQPNDLTLEKGSMVNPDTGIDTAYEELWHDATPTAVPGEPAVRAIVLQTEDEKNGVRGSVVRLGRYAQGLIRVGEHISLERWEWKDGWKRTIRMGDAELPIGKILGEEALKEGDTVDVDGREWKVIEESGKDESKL